MVALFVFGIGLFVYVGVNLSSDIFSVGFA